MSNLPQGASASGNSTTGFFNPAGPKKDQFNRKYAPLQQAEVLRDADRAASRDFHVAMEAVTKDSNYIRNTDPDTVKAFKTQLAQLASSQQTEQLKKVAEATLNKIISHKIDAKEESEKRDNLSQELISITNERDTIQAKLTAETETVSQLISDESELSLRLLSRTAERDGYMSKVTVSTKNCEEMMLTNNVLKKQLEQKQARIDQLETAQQEADRAKKGLEDQIKKVTKRGDYYKELFTKEKNGTLSRDQKVHELQESLSTAQAERDAIDQKMTRLLQTREEEKRAHEEALEELTSDYNQLQLHYDRQKELKEQSVKHAEQLRVGMDQLTKQIQNLTTTMNNSNNRATKGDDQIDRLRSERDQAVRDTDRFRLLYEQEHGRADMEHRKAEKLLEDKMNNSKAYRESLDKLGQENKNFYRDLRGEVEKNNKDSVDRLKEWQAERRRLKSIIDGYEIADLGLGRSPHNDRNAETDIDASRLGELMRSLPLIEKSLLQAEAPGLWKAVDTAPKGSATTGSTKSREVPLPITDQDSAGSTRQSGDGDIEMREHTEGPQDTSMLDESPEEPSRNTRAGTETPVAGDRQNSDFEMQQDDEQQEVTSPDLSEGGVSLVGVWQEKSHAAISGLAGIRPPPVPKFPEVMKSVETDDSPTGESSLAGGNLHTPGADPGRSFSRESPAISAVSSMFASSATKKKYTESDVEFLIQGLPADGPRTQNVHASVKQALASRIAEWEKKAKSKGQWARPSDTIRCVTSRLSRLKVTKNVNGPDHKVACERCVKAMVPCVLAMRNSPPVVLPLPKSRRSRGATERDMGYYIVKVEKKQ
jgi:hypothetical protein